MNPNSRVAWGYKAHALSKLKQYDEAFACYQQALKCQTFGMISESVN